MEDKVDMSLADIIKQSKQLRIGGRRRRGNPRNFGGGGIRRTTRGAMRNGSGGGPLRPRRQANMRSPYRRESGDIDSRWEHDMYDGFTSVRSPRSISGSLVSGSASGSAKLLISNLEFGVSDSDVTELFAEFGPLKSAAVHYDRSGRSLGTADVIFLRREDAIKAMKQYNNVPLDGRPMHIQLATSEVPFDRGLKQGVRQGRIQRSGRPGLFQRGRGGNRRGGGGGGGNQRNQGRKMTAEELDAELDAYVNETK